MYIYMEMSQGNSLYSYFKQTKMSLFFIYKIGEQEAEQVLTGVFGTSGRWEELEKGHGRVNIVQILCTYVCKWKNDTC
jgi:hypothetical protein